MRLALELAEMSGRMKDLAAELSYVGDEEMYAPTLTKTEMAGMVTAAAVQVEGEVAEIRRLSRLCSSWAARPDVGAMYGRIGLLATELDRLAGRLREANEICWSVVDGHTRIEFGASDEDNVEFDGEPYPPGGIVGEESEADETNQD